MYLKFPNKHPFVIIYYCSIKRYCFILVRIKDMFTRMNIVLNKEITVIHFFHTITS